jgi:hypothetical protein
MMRCDLSARIRLVSLRSVHDMNARYFIVALACWALLLAACSSSTPPSTSSAVDTAGPCGGLTPVQAASILHVPPADAAGPQHLSTFSCVYRSRKDFYTSLTFNVYVEASADQARRKLAALKDGLADLSPIVAVDHLGDEAWRAPDSRVRRLLVRKDNVWLDVVTPGDEASQRKVARIVLAHIH